MSDNFVIAQSGVTIGELLDIAEWHAERALPRHGADRRDLERHKQIALALLRRSKAIAP